MIVLTAVLKIWQPLLAASLCELAMVKLLEAVVGRLVNEVLAFEDISVEECGKVYLSKFFDDSILIAEISAISRGIFNEIVCRSTLTIKGSFMFSNGCSLIFLVSASSHHTHGKWLVPEFDNFVYILFLMDCGWLGAVAQVDAAGT